MDAQLAAVGGHLRIHQKEQGMLCSRFRRCYACSVFQVRIGLKRITACFVIPVGETKQAVIYDLPVPKFFAVNEKPPGFSPFQRAPCPFSTLYPPPFSSP